VLNRERGEKLSAAREPGIMIRRATKVDLPAIAAIEAESFPSPWGEGLYRPELTRPASVFLVAEAAGETTGYACAFAVLDEAHLLKLAVRPELRRRGIGRALLAALAAALRDMGARELWLEVRAGNQAGRAFYRRLGFDEVGVRKRYYSDTGEDAVVLVGELED
jgi:[ribosomal protein S18]-alanine N-acetyltransferase